MDKHVQIGRKLYADIVQKKFVVYVVMLNLSMSWARQKNNWKVCPSPYQFREPLNAGSHWKTRALAVFITVDIGQ